MLYTYIYTDDIQSNYELFEYIYCTKSLQFAGSSNGAAQVALSVFSQKKPDIIFVDTDMKDSAALQLYKMLSSLASIVFVTSDAKSSESLSSANLYFLQKPYNYPKFLDLINRLNSGKPPQTDKSLKPQKEDYFFIKGDRGKIIRIDIPEILFIEGSQNYVTVHTRDDKHITYLRLKEVERALPGDVFIRIHKSFIVNKHKIRMVENAKLTLDNKAELTVGYAYKSAFLNALNANVLKSSKPG